MRFRYGIDGLLILILLVETIAPAPAQVRQRSLSPVAASGRPLLELMENQSLGIVWTNNLPPQKYSERQNMMNGAGVALGDFDGDGWCDVFLCNKFGHSALLRNRGNWRFEDVTASAGVSCTNQISTGAVFADIDGDRKLDLLVTSFGGPNACFRNLGNGTFTNITAQVGFQNTGGSTSLALADLDGDADLDLYVNYFGTEALLRDGASFSTRMVGGNPVVTGRHAKRLVIVNGKVMELGEPDMIYRHDAGRFIPLSWQEFFQDENGAAAAAPLDFGLAVQIRDLDLDGDPDIYTCNDFQTPDRIWLNDSKGHFKAIPPLALRNRSYASMGVDFADVNRDGFLDFVTLEMLSRDPARHLRQSSPKSPAARTIGEIDKREDVARNVLCLNRGDNTFTEIAWFSGVAATDWSWTPIFIDLDLDGYEDLLVSNGHLHDVNDRDAADRMAPLPREQRRKALIEYPRLASQNYAFRNNRALQFENMSEPWGFNSTQITHGMALADLDNDGDYDVVGNCVNAAPLFYRNNSVQPRIAVRLRGAGANTQGIGARINVRSGSFVQMQEMICGGRYLSSDEALRVFAVPPSAEPPAIEVLWRSGRRSFVQAAKGNTEYEIQEPSDNAATSSPNPSPAPKEPWFQDVSDRLNHRHTEAPFDDFSRQPLLPRRLSQLGPGVVWSDLNGDGFEDIVIGTGRNGKIAALQSDGKGSFAPANLEQPSSPDDSAGLIAMFLRDKPAILAAISRYETASNEPPIMVLSSGSAPEKFGAQLPNAASPGPLAGADIDADGDLDLFLGGRVVPGDYPASASGLIFRNDNNLFQPDAAASELIKATGMISAALFSDLNEDGFPELVIAEEWGPISIYWNDRGQFMRKSEIPNTLGWWNSITAGDLDGDGRLDLVAGNWGLNSHYARGQAGKRWSIHFGDLEPSVQGELIETYTDNRVRPVRDLAQLSQAMPSLTAIFPSHSAFATARLEFALSAQFVRGKSLMATELSSCVFWNKGDGNFRSEPLPAEAQWAPAFGLTIADFDNDGREDLFIAQNFFAVRTEDDRLDAGRGLLLQGAADGKLMPLSGALTGLRIYGEQRGSAACDFDLDGRLDLAVTQNGAETKLYRNAFAAPGLCVRLQGQGQNRTAIGAVLRADLGSGFGPAREIHAGSGYWSQDSAILVFPAATRELSIRWPGGQQTRTRIPPGTREILINPAGEGTPAR